MPENDLKRLELLEANIKTLENKRIRASERLDLLRIQRDTLLEDLKKHGVDAKSVKSELDKLKTQITEELDTIEKQIPSEIKESNVRI